MALSSAVAVAGGGSGLPSLSARPDWRQALPTLNARTAILREVTGRDAPSLSLALGNADVLRYLPVGPSAPEQFARFVRWVRRERRAGRYLCFGVVPHGLGGARGLFQLWPIEPGFGTAEMGFALDPALWGTGTFLDCANAVVEFAFGPLGVRRLEFRSAAGNGRGMGALRKLGAVQEGTLRSCFPCTSGILDHTMWSILAHEWHDRRVTARRRAQ